MTDAEVRAARQRFQMTPSDIVTAQLWILHRDRTLNYPAGIRRRADRAHHVRRPMKRWREMFAMTRTSLARAVTRPTETTGGGTVRYETIQSLEDGHAQWRDRAVYLPRIAAVFGITTDQIL